MTVKIFFRGMFCLFVAAVSLSNPAAALENDDEGYAKGAAAFLDFGMYARAAGMGRAYSAVARGGSGFLYNPAGLAYMTGSEFSNTSAVLNLDRSYFVSGIAWPFIKEREYGAFVDMDESWKSKLLKPKEMVHHGVGFTFVNFGISNIEGRDDWGNRTKTFEDAEKMFALSYGYRLYKNFSAGFGIKYLRQNLEEAKADGMGFDFGLLYKLMNNRMGFSFVGRDIFSRIKWDVTDQIVGSDYSYREDVLAKYVIGFSYNTEDEKTLFCLDLKKDQGVKMFPYLGVEYTAAKPLRMRAGLDKYMPSAGIGLYAAAGDYLGINMDYSYTYDLDELANIHYITINISYDMLSRECSW